MFAKVNRFFNLATVLGLLTEKVYERWSAFIAKFPDAQAQVKEAVDDPAVAVAIDPQNLMPQHQRRDIAKTALLALADLFGADFVAGQLARHPKTTVISANQAMDLAGGWLPENATSAQVIACYLKLAIANCLIGQGFGPTADADADAAAAAYSECANTLINEAADDSETLRELREIFLNGAALEDKEPVAAEAVEPEQPVAVVEQTEQVEQKTADDTQAADGQAEGETADGQAAEDKPAEEQAAASDQKGKDKRRK